MFELTETYSQAGEPKSQLASNIIHIIKDVSNSYSLSSAASHSGTFITYLIIGR
jgi:hypothetical protein